MIAVVGSRHGVNPSKVTELLDTLETDVLVSGGAQGVDTWAEQYWLSLGRRVLSLRPVKTDTGYMIEEWDLGGEMPRIRRLYDHPSWEDHSSAAGYAKLLCFELADTIHVFGVYPVPYGVTVIEHREDSR